MSAISVLPAEVVNKIAAGEVIERPASVVKELLENALDAQATRIDVEVEEGGRQLVRVRDNGRGIQPDDMALVFTPHATSKLRSSDELFHVATLGFRGEALASIGSVAECLVRSRVAAEPMGRQIAISGGRLGEVTECGGPVGTTVEVRRLFFNTPVRRKFLRTVQTEMGHIVEAFTRIALARPDIHLTLKHNGREVFDLPGHDQLLRRLQLFFGQEVADALLPVDHAAADLRLWGYVGRPTQTRATAAMEYLFLNGRYIRDRQCQHAVREAYRGLLTAGRCPIVFLFLEMAPETVDINVHPTKIEVRFRDSHLVYSHVLAAIRQKFLQTDLTTTLAAPSLAAEAGADDLEADRQARLREAIAEYFKRQGPETLRPTPAVARETPAVQELAPAPRLPIAAPPEPADTTAAVGPLAAPEAPLPPPGGPPGPFATAAPRAMQMHNRYVIVEADDGILIIDQHALHERILYEQFRRALAAGRIESQRLLVPETLELSGPAQAVLAREHQTLTELGWEIEPFGANAAVVHAFPRLLDRRDLGPIARDLLDGLAQTGLAPDRHSLLDELLHRMACQAAVKAGQPLQPQEVQALVRERHLAADSHHCPHGRPASLLLTKEELDRQFKRT